MHKTTLISPFLQHMLRLPDCHGVIYYEFLKIIQLTLCNSFEVTFTFNIRILMELPSVHVLLA